MSADTLPADRSPEDLAELLAHLAQIERWIAPIAREDRSCPGDADDDLYRARTALRAYARDVDLLSKTARRLTADCDRLRYIAENPETMRLLYDMLGELWVNNETGDVRTGLLKQGHAPLDGIRQLIDECKEMDAARTAAAPEEGR